MKFILLLIILLTVGPVSAQDRAFDCLESGTIDSVRARELTARVQKAYASISSIQGRFAQNSYVDALEISEASVGQVWFKKPGLMRWHYTSPSEQIFVVREGTLWLYQVEPRQVIVDDFKETLISDLPVSFLLGIGDINRDFRLLKACQNPQGIVMDLAAAQGSAKGAELKSFKLLVNADSFIPKGALIIDVGNNSTAMLLEDVVLNAELPAEVFSSDFGSGLDVSDRRIERQQSQQ